jgi:hypothetical protein
LPAAMIQAPVARSDPISVRKSPPEIDHIVPEKCTGFENREAEYSEIIGRAQRNFSHGVCKMRHNLFIVTHSYMYLATISLSI